MSEVLDRVVSINKTTRGTKKLEVVISRVGQGKGLTLINKTYSRYKERALFVSLEESVQNIYRKFNAVKAMDDTKRRLPRKIKKEFKKQFGLNFTFMHRCMCVIHIPASLYSRQDILDKIKELIEFHNPDRVYLDSFSIYAYSEGTGEGIYQRSMVALDEITSLGVPMVTTMMANRSIMMGSDDPINVNDYIMHRSGQIERGEIVVTNSRIENNKLIEKNLVNHKELVVMDMDDFSDKMRKLQQ